MVPHMSIAIHGDPYQVANNCNREKEKRIVSNTMCFLEVGEALLNYHSTIILQL